MESSHELCETFVRDRDRDALSSILSEALIFWQSRSIRVIGAAGSGKSSLAGEVAAYAASDFHGRVYRVSAKPDDPDGALVRRFLEARFSLGALASDQARSNAIYTHVDRTLGPERAGEIASLLAGRLGLESRVETIGDLVDDEFEQRRLAAEEEAFALFVREDCRRRPLLLLVDDAHDCDERSLCELVAATDDAIGPLVVVLFGRPELDGRYGDLIRELNPAAIRFELARLDERSARALLELELGQRSEVPAAVFEAALAYARGNPGLLKRATEAFVASGVLFRGSNGRVVFDEAHLDALSTCFSDGDRKAARIAELSSAELLLLQQAASVGSVFWSGALAAIQRAEDDDPDLWSVPDRDPRSTQSALERLAGLGYVLEVPEPSLSGEREFVFKEASEREALLAMVPPSVQRSRHRAVADWFEQHHHPASLDDDLLAGYAEHLAQAGAEHAAGAAYIRAAELAHAAYAPAVAATRYERGLALLDEGDATLRLQALHDYADVLLKLGRTDAAADQFQELLALGHRLGLPVRCGTAHLRLGSVFHNAGQFRPARHHLDAALQCFVTAGDRLGIASTHDQLGRLLWTEGRPDAALKELELALVEREQLGDARAIAATLNGISLVWLDRGEVGRAFQALNYALDICTALDDRIGQAETLTNLGRVASYAHDDRLAFDYYAEAHAAALRSRDLHRQAPALTSLAEAYLHLGHARASWDVAEQAVLLIRDLGDDPLLIDALRVSARAAFRCDEPQAAKRSIREALDLAARIRSKVHLARVLRSLGELTGAGAWGPVHESKAADYFRRSVELAREAGLDIEVAKSYRAFVRFAERFSTSPKIREQAARLSEMAEELFVRFRYDFSSAPPASIPRTRHIQAA